MSPAVLLLALAGFAAAAGPSGSKRPDIDDKMLLTQAPVPWLRVYVLQPYREFWNLTVELKDLDKELPRLQEVLEKAGGSLTVPIQNLAASPESRLLQMSWRLPHNNGKALLKAIRKFAKTADPLVRPPSEPIPLAEVRAKLAKLSEERETGRQALSSLPAVAALLEESLEHLRLAQSVGEKAQGLILLNMTVRETAKP